MSEPAKYDRHALAVLNLCMACRDRGVTEKWPAIAMLVEMYEEQFAELAAKRSDTISRQIDTINRQAAEIKRLRALFGPEDSRHPAERAISLLALCKWLGPNGERITVTCGPDETTGYPRQFF